jgi:hypothetical protein
MLLAALSVAFTEAITERDGKERRAAVKEACDIHAYQGQKRRQGGKTLIRHRRLRVHLNAEPPFFKC